MRLLHQHLQTAIREREDGAVAVIYVLSALCHFHPPQVAIIRELWPSWMSDILGSGHGAVVQSRMAEEVVRLVWEQVKSVIMSPTYIVETTWIAPLLSFLRLGEEIHWDGSSMAHAGVFALRIISRVRGKDDLGPAIMPILASALQPAHPLQSRNTALKTFCQLGFGWLSSHMEGISSLDRAGLLRAVSDPFQFTPCTILQDDQYVFGGKYNPMNAAAILIEFASSDLWRDHLRHSNFISCEEVISTEEGRESAFTYLKHTAGPWPSLCTPAKIVSAIERLETLRCPNTVEVVLTFIWASRGVDQPSIDLDGWRLIQRKTLAFYQTHGVGRLKVLSQHITANQISHSYSRDPRCRVEGVRLPVRIATEERKWGCMEDWDSDTRLAQVCQRKMLYQLFGCNPTTWEEMVAAGSERADEGVPARFVDWACDYP